jgi:L-seryl-tRNA(Ser) seleniumtransferase
VDRLVRDLPETGLPHPLLVEAARQALAAGDPDSAEERVWALKRSLIASVVNGTGVILHTNLGRAPLAFASTGTYSNLELDLGTGRRGSRQAHVAGLVARLIGAESALVVNNGAAALLLVLATLASGRGVVVSRGELVEIGGGFRLPEVLGASGARLVEVGTTNRTRRGDYAQAVLSDGDVALLLKVHQSNYRMAGFTAEAGVADLASLGPPVVYDIGSGLLDADTPWLGGPPPAWLAGEPGARQSLAAGAALVTFSGDKLMGGPQAGIVAGQRSLVEACSRHPLARALRPGGMVMQALQEVCLTYMRREKVPFWRMATLTPDELRGRAEDILVKVGDPRWSATNCRSVPGGGSLPGTEIDFVGLRALGDHRGPLLRAPVPVVARVHEEATIIDLRTVDPAQDAQLAAALESLPPP